MNQYLLSVYDVEGDAAGAPATPEEMRTFMGRVIALEEIPDAIRDLTHGRVRGKVVIANEAASR